LQSQVLLRQSWTFPVCLIDAPAIDHVDLTNAHRNGCRNRSVKNLWPRQRKNQAKRQWGRRFGIEDDCHVESFVIVPLHSAATEFAADRADA
jgi:hypothetical protein